MYAGAVKEFRVAAVPCFCTDGVLFWRWLTAKERASPALKVNVVAVFTTSLHTHLYQPTYCVVSVTVCDGDRFATPRVRISCID